MHGEYGIEDVVLSMPCVVGSNGIEMQVPVVINDEEKEKLQESARILKETLSTLDI
ncbi:MAG: L-lactate dehydrogenase, partial [Lachnospiraceae bacterium]|nr:L-lactate dehydrogenase [Lachnospiraceae bacterium]